MNPNTTQPSATYPSGLRGGFAKPVFTGSNPVVALLYRRAFWPAAFFLTAIGCSDPPDPPPTAGPEDIPRWSTAPHVHWTGLETQTERIAVVFVDEPNGHLDRVAADPDVTTFLNDKFQPIFLVPDVAPEFADSTVLFFAADGCLLAKPTQIRRPQDFIDLANQVMLQGNTVIFDDHHTPLHWNLEIPPEHRLLKRCSRN